MTFFIVLLLSISSVAVADEAKDLLNGVEYPKLYKLGLDRQVDEMISERPVLKSIKPQVREQLEKLVPLEPLERRIVENLNKTFTKTELREMTTFFSTATGRKVAREMPVMMGRVYDAEEERVQKTLPTFLFKALMDSGAEKEKEKNKPAK